MTKEHKGQRVGYIRVSSVDQNTERQLEGITVDRMFEDKASGKDTNRPQLQAALEYVRKDDTLVVHSMDRLARNTEDLLRTVRELKAKGVAVEFIKPPLRFAAGTDSPMDDMMMTMLGGFAQFERAMIRERQQEGIEAAKKRGVYKGRKPALTPEQVAELRKRAAAGEQKTALAKEYGISRETLYQQIKAD
ncbi:recombinase family protein [Paraburkholderia tropica]|uniref:Site-specific DNA recombinase n=1 Tax=Paraburkholderia tropica TaxID=92647 RepID=A0AAQ1GHA0_9BURK|nr:recombinase family protein [Paraburkholderia tropica]RQN38548.1 recombinase family protein [Paraburkholderia tropica]SEJ88462.1 Site-specific DNA recombinase [Paraburkholderia tropica]